jgi:hypothetical protein
MKTVAMKNFFTVLGFSLLLGSCTPVQKSQSEMVISQGISGIVEKRSGNQMPSPDVMDSKAPAIKTMVYVFESTNISQVERSGSEPFYKTIGTKLIDSVSTDENGRFAIRLEPGSYSLFTKVNGQYYANSFDQFNNISPAKVEQGKVTQVNITISAGASF